MEVIGAVIIMSKSHQQKKQQGQNRELRAVHPDQVREVVVYKARNSHLCGKCDKPIRVGDIYVAVACVVGPKHSHFHFSLKYHPAHLPERFYELMTPEEERTMLQKLVS